MPETHEKTTRTEAEALVQETWDDISQLPDGTVKDRLLATRRGLSGVNLETAPDEQLPEMVAMLRRLLEDAQEEQRLLNATDYCMD